MCEKAKIILWPVLLKYQYSLVEIDIAASDELIELYGTRIPVLGTLDKSSELNWPFSADDVEKLLSMLAKR